MTGAIPINKDRKRAFSNNDATLANKNQIVSTEQKIQMKKVEETMNNVSSNENTGCLLV